MPLRRPRDDRGDDGVASSTQNRMATLLLLAKGREPSWSRLRPQLQPSAPQIPQRPDTNSTPFRATAAVTAAEEVSHQSSRRRQIKVIVCLWLISVTIKVLLFPAYHSTDFDVHRHWKAVTLHLPIAEWYYDDKYVKTRHTLDYPPAFALLEYCFAVVLSQIQRVIAWCSPVETLHTLATCLSLRDDVTVETEPPSFPCVALMRSTVVFLSDVVYWIGSGAVAWTVTRTHNDAASTRCHKAGLVFLLLIGDPALLWLDHIHFQYNGLLLGILLSSLAALLHANNVSAVEQPTDATEANDAVARQPYKGTSRRNVPTVSSSLQRQPQPQQHQHHWCHLFAAAMYSLLVSLKHLYVTSCLWYGMYLLRRYCYTSINIKNTTTPRSTLRFCVLFVARFLALAVTAISVAAIPMAVFVVAIQQSSNEKTASIVFGFELDAALGAWMNQLWRRLFPFGRGLVHSYWAGNVWALVVSAHKVIVWVATRILLRTTDVDGKTLLTSMLQSVLIITPSVTAVCMLVAQVPGLCLAWQAAAERSNAKLLQSFAMTALGTFLFQYHAHEKAILTALLPGSLWACHIVASPPVSSSHGVVLEAWYIMGEFTAYSLLGIFPLLFQHQEFLLKATSSTVYMALWYALSPRQTLSTTTSQSPKLRQQAQRQLRQHERRQWNSVIRLSLAFATVVLLEILTPLGLFGRYEFAPLAMTSLVCAVAFIRCFRQLNQYKS